MSKKSKLILSIIGVSALIVPAVLLIITTSRTPQIPEVSTQKREIDAASLEETVKKSLPTPSPLPTPTPASPSATPKVEGTKSAR